LLGYGDADNGRVTVTVQVEVTALQVLWALTGAAGLLEVTVGWACWACETGHTVVDTATMSVTTTVE